MTLFALIGLLSLVSGFLSGLVGIGGGMVNLCLSLETLKVKQDSPVEAVITECLFRKS